MKITKTRIVIISHILLFIMTYSALLTVSIFGNRCHKSDCDINTNYLLTPRSFMIVIIPSYAVWIISLPILSVYDIYFDQIKFTIGQSAVSVFISSIFNIFGMASYVVYRECDICHTNYTFVYIISAITAGNLCLIYSFILFRHQNSKVHNSLNFIG